MDAMIATMTTDDYDEAYALWSATPGMGLNAHDDSREGIGRFLARNPRTCLVARREGRLVGVLLAGHDGRRGHLYHAAVLPEERGRGVSRALVEAAMEALAAEGIAKASLVVFSDNALGNAFWERLGFGARPDLVYRNRMTERG